MCAMYLGGVGRSGRRSRTPGVTTPRHTLQIPEPDWRQFEFQMNMQGYDRPIDYLRVLLFVAGVFVRYIPIKPEDIDEAFALSKVGQAIDRGWEN